MLIKIVALAIVFTLAASGLARAEEASPSCNAGAKKLEEVLKALGRALEVIARPDIDQLKLRIYNCSQSSWDRKKCLEESQRIEALWRAVIEAKEREDFGHLPVLIDDFDRADQKFFQTIRRNPPVGSINPPPIPNMDGPQSPKKTVPKPNRDGLG